MDAFATTRDLEFPLEGAPTVVGVLHVLSARVQVSSFTGLFSPESFDVTPHVAAALDGASGELLLGGLAIPPSALQMPGQLPLVGKRTLRVRVRVRAGVPDAATPQGVTEVACARAAALGRALAEEGLLDGAARAGNTANNYFKLPEWLQVEIMQLFGTSMFVSSSARKVKAPRPPTPTKPIHPPPHAGSTRRGSASPFSKCSKSTAACSRRRRASLLASWAGCKTRS
jgi:hypothetical protein